MDDEIVVELLNGNGMVIDSHIWPIPHSLRDASCLPQIRVYYRKPVGVLPLTATAEFGPAEPGRQ